MGRINKAQIVIIGAGFAGLRCALELDKRLAGTENEIVLVDSHPYHLVTPALYEVAAAEASSRAITVPITSILETTDIIFKRDAAVSIDSRIRRIKLTRGDLDYDVLLITMGSRTDYFGIPGLEESSVSLKTIYDGGNIRLKLSNLFRKDRFEAQKE